MFQSLSNKLIRSNAAILSRMIVDHKHHRDDLEVLPDPAGSNISSQAELYYACSHATQRHRAWVKARSEGRFWGVQVQ